MKPKGLPSLSRQAFICAKLPLLLARKGFVSSATAHPLVPKLLRRAPRRFMLPVPPHNYMPLSMKSDSLLLAAPAFSDIQAHDVALTGAIVVLVIAWLALWQRLTAYHVVTSTATRKVIHISCGPSFVLFWPFFTHASSARFVAAMIPLIFIGVLAISGSARDGEKRGALGRAISREGSPREALQGPLYYSAVLLVATVLLFKTVAATVAIMQLCFGDGAAEVFGRRFGARSQWGLSWTGNKSVAGTAAFVVAAFFGSWAGVGWLSYHGLTEISLGEPLNVVALAAISVACAALELVPKEVLGDDNLTIATTAAMLSVALFGPQAFY